MSAAGSTALPEQRDSGLPTSDEVVAGLPWRWRVHGSIFLIGGLGFMFDAWDVALNGFLIPLLMEEWGLSAGQAAWIATSNLLGMAVGAFTWGGIADRIGRKRAFSLTLLTFAIFTVLGAMSPNLVVFCVFRFLAGFGLGGCIPVDYALVGEFTPRRQRGRVLTAMDGWWPVGVSLCGLVSAWLIAQFGDWRLILLVMVLPALLVFFVRLYVPESPLYLARAGRHEEADRVVAALVRRTGGTQTRWRLPEPGEGGTQTGTAWAGQLLALWRYSPRITATSWLLFIAILLLYYAALTWLPNILRQQGMENHAAFLVTSAMTGVGIIGVLVCAVLVDRTGRKWMLGATSVLAAVFLVAFAVLLEQGTELSLAARLCILAFGFLIQMSIPALYTYVSELYPTELRGSGFGWASAASRVAIGLAPLAFGSLLWPVLGLPLTFALTGALVIVAVLVMAWSTRETTHEILR